MTLTATPPADLVDLSSIKTVKQVPYTEYFVSGHRTCQGCESALVMRYIAKAAGPRTIVMGSTGCMYVANTSYYTTPWVVPWMHTQLGSSGSAALGAAAALKALMRKGKMKKEPINVIAFFDTREFDEAAPVAERLANPVVALFILVVHLAQVGGDTQMVADEEQHGLRVGRAEVGVDRREFGLLGAAAVEVLQAAHEDHLERRHQRRRLRTVEDLEDAGFGEV